jgi:hypothetical protein
MSKDLDQELAPICNECDICFFVWWGYESRKNLCDFCEKKSKSFYPKHIQLQRTLDIMESTRASSLPDILRKMYDVLWDKA